MITTTSQSNAPINSQLPQRALKPKKTTLEKAFFACPLSGKIFRKAVVAPCGHTFIRPDVDIKRCCPKDSLPHSEPDLRSNILSQNS